MIRLLFHLEACNITLLVRVPRARRGRRGDHVGQDANAGGRAVGAVVGRVVLAGIADEDGLLLDVVALSADGLTLVDAVGEVGALADGITLGDADTHFEGFGCEFSWVW